MPMQKINETPEERAARLEKEAYEAQEKAKLAMDANKAALAERQVRLPIASLMRACWPATLASCSAAKCDG
jgi:hypothetical protein